MNTNTLEQTPLLGYPVHEDENMPDISANSLSIAFGGFQRVYTIVDRRSRSLPSHILFYSTKRVGGGMRDFRAITLMKFGANICLTSRRSRNASD
jgi:HK97 family phage major capsid protein